MDAISLAGIRRSVELDFLLLEVAAVLLIHQHQVEEVLDAELVVHQLVGGREVIWRQKQPACRRNPVLLILGSLHYWLVVKLTCACCSWTFGNECCYLLARHI